MPFYRHLGNPRLKYLALTVASALGVGFGLFYLPNTILSGIITGAFFLIILLISSALLAQTKFFKPLAWPLVWSVVTVVGLFGLINIKIYYLYQLTSTTIFLTTALLATITALVLSKSKHLSLEQLKIKKSSLLSYLNTLDPLAIIIVALQGLLIFKIWQKSTDILLASPWQLFGKNFFIVFALTTALLIVYQFKYKKNSLGLVLTVFHYFIMFSLAAIVYKLGFGYDPFLHRATETHIFQYGFIEPKTPFYLGQYVAVNLLAQIANLPIKLIDIWLVPLITTICLPVATYFGMRYGFHLPRRWARIAAVILPLYPLNTMFATTPHNLANLILLIFILVSPYYLRQRSFWLPMLVLALVAAATHPLSGIFALLMFLALTIFKFRKRLQSAYIYLVGLTLALSMAVVPILFFVYLASKAYTIGVFGITASGLTNFIKLFQDPYYYIYKPAPLVIDAVYLYQKLIPIIIVLASAFGLWCLKNKSKIIYPAFALAVLSNVFFLSVWVDIPLLSSFEKIQYAERLRHIILFFLLPPALFGLIYLGRKMASFRWYTIFAFALTASILLTGSWYLTYPQKNQIVNFPGLNVTRPDLDAVEYIHQSSGETDYIVISNILVAAAAVDKYGFYKYYATDEGQTFYYSIPTGGILYQAYLKMIYEGQKKEYMMEVIEKTGVNKAYFVLNSYWDESAKIAEGAKKTADSWQSLADGKIWVFEYSR